MELELSAVGASQNLLDISVTSTLNDFHGMSSNNESSLTGHHNQQQQINAAVSSKKEGNLLSWFTSSSTSSSAINNPSMTASSSATVTATTPPTIAPRTYNSNENELIHYAQQQQQLQDGSSSPNMKISNKISYGEKFISKFNKNGNKATSSSDQHAPSKEQVSTGVSKEPQQKSSRRTTSLLNLFMSNSQGKHTHKHSFTF